MRREIKCQRKLKQQKCAPDVTGQRGSGSIDGGIEAIALEKR